MKITDLKTRHETVEIEIEGQKLGFVLTTHANASAPERHIACLHALGFEVAVDDESRGAGMLYLSQVLKALGYKLAMMAFEQEGVVGIDISSGRERRRRG